MNRMTEQELRAAREAMNRPVVAGSTLAFLGRELLAEIDALRQERDYFVAAAEREGKLLEEGEGTMAMADYALKKVACQRDALAARVRELEGLLACRDDGEPLLPDSDRYPFDGWNADDAYYRGRLDERLALRRAALAPTQRDA